jgi:hypothetical protein
VLAPEIVKITGMNLITGLLHELSSGYLTFPYHTAFITNAMFLSSTTWGLAFNGNNWYARAVPRPSLRLVMQIDAWYT